MPTSKQETTLEQVAKLSGVSRSTASRALRGQAGVADDVRTRVQLVASSLNYRPNRAAQNLAGARTSIVGLLMGQTSLSKHPYSTRLVEAMARAADKLDQGLMLVMSETEPGRAVQNLLQDRLVDGVILSSVILGEDWAEDVIGNAIPSVTIGSQSAEFDVSPAIDVENLNSSARLVDHLMDTGCTRIGTITGPPGRDDAAQRLEGFRVAHANRGIPVDESLVIISDYQYDTGYTAALQLLERGVDGIVAANDLSAVGALDATLDQGWSVPHDVSITGFDGSIDRNQRELTTMLQPFDKIAHTAISTLLSLIAGHQVPSRQSLEPDLRLGATTRVADA